jgi:hypothetical protein
MASSGIGIGGTMVGSDTGSGGPGGGGGGASVAPGGPGRGIGGVFFAHAPAATLTTSAAIVNTAALCVI